MWAEHWISIFSVTQWSSSDWHDWELQINDRKSQRNNHDAVTLLHIGGFWAFGIIISASADLVCAERGRTAWTENNLNQP